MSNLFTLNNREIIDLFEIKLNDFEGYFRFHGSKNLKSNLIFKSNEYLYIPCEISNLEYSSQGKQNRPNLILSNTNNFMSNLIKDRGDLLGKRLYRKKVLARDLDLVNFNGQNTLGERSKDGFSGEIMTDTFVISKKNAESKEKIEFTLSNILDVDGSVLPRRKVFSNYCHWQYRGAGCCYGLHSKYEGPAIVTSSLTNERSNFELLCSSIPNLKNNLLFWLDNDDESKTFVSDGAKFKSSNGDIYDTSVADQKLGKVNAIGRKITAWKNKAYQVNTTYLTEVSQPGVLISESNCPREARSFQFTKPRGQNQSNESPPVLLAQGNKGVYFLGKENEGYGPSKITLEENFDNSLQSWDEVNGLVDYKGCTLFYVPVMANFLNSSGLVRNVFCTDYTDDNNKLYLGHNEGYRGVSFFKNTKIEVDIFAKMTEPSINYYTPWLWGASLSSQAGEFNKFFMNVYDEDKGSDENRFDNSSFGKSVVPSDLNQGNWSNFGINLRENEESECIVFEIIAFKTILTNTERNLVMGYLANKYLGSSALVEIDRPDLVSTITKNSSEFFSGFEDGNLGVPIADENDKLFMASSDLKYYETYGFSDLTYKGDYDSQTIYKAGDFVKIDPEINFDFSKEYLYKSSEFPSRFFVCVSPLGSFKKHPFDNTDLWVEDKCSKKLSGCKIRFNNKSLDLPIPFGGFPGTADYGYRFPGS